jgi:hypothetical protein
VKNFPHQMNNLARLKAGLATARDLGASAGDDGALGYEMARRGVYTFRGLVTPLADRIAAEQLKQSGSQGARTAARDLRRFLRDLGFLQAAPSSATTPLGDAFLAASPGSTAERDAWRTAITGLTLTGRDANTSHVGCILLRLLADTGGLPKPALGLALEPVDDSEPEYQRALALTHLDTAARRATLGITEYMDDDSVKILPALAQQAGLIEEVGGEFRLTAAGAAAHAACSAGGATVATPAYPPAGLPAHAAIGEGRIRRRPRGPISRSRRWVDRPPGLEPGEIDEVGFRALTPEEQQEAVRLRHERTHRHNAVVAAAAGLATNDEIDLHEDPTSYDLLIEPLGEDEELVLVEVKTVDEDVETQARLAIGQLLWYRYRNVAREWPGREVELLAVFDGPVPRDVVEVFDALDIGVAIIDDAGYHPVNAAAERTKGRFGA